MIGQVVDGHEIIRPLGTGGMGEVYLARGMGGTLRAFKIVRTDQETSAQATARFQREVLALSKLHHPGIVRILDAGKLPNGALYLAMEYVAGPDVQAAVGWDGPFPVVEALRILTQVAAALAYAHEAGVVHRDLKPSNVILADGDPGCAKIIDFGLARVVEDQGLALTKLTDDQQLIGSPLYLAPEQSANSDVGPPADIYALGGIAYYLLTGEPMFKPRPPVALMYAHANETPEPLSKRCRGETLPTGLDEVVRACVAKAPAERPTANALVAELDRLLALAPTAIGGRRAQRLFTSSGVSDFGQALTNQIRQILVELAAVDGRPTDDVDRIQRDLSELEIDLAMIEADVGIALDPAAKQRRDAVAAAVAQMQRALSDAFRELFDVVNADRPRAPADAASLYAELDGLVQQYLAL